MSDPLRFWRGLVIGLLLDTVMFLVVYAVWFAGMAWMVSR